MSRRLVVSWRAARGLRVWHLVDGGLDAERTRCGDQVRVESPTPVKRDLCFSAVPAARPTEMCERCWPVRAEVADRDPAPSPTIGAAA